MDPQLFFITKGILGVAGVLALVVHMNRSWSTLDPEGGIGQRLRFITLFYFAVLIVAASYDQVRAGVVHISLNNVGGFGGAILLIVTGLVSIVEGTKHHTRH